MPKQKIYLHNKAKVVWALWMPCNVALPRRNCCSSIDTNLFGSWKRLASFQDLDDFGFEDMMPPTLPPPETLACEKLQEVTSLLNYSIRYTSWIPIVIRNHRHCQYWTMNNLNSNELWWYRLRISWAARPSLHQEEAPRVVASWNCCNCGLCVAPGDVEVEHGGTLLWGHGVTWTKANGKKSFCPYGRRYAMVRPQRYTCATEMLSKKHLAELNALRGAIGRVLRTSWSLRTFPEVWISTVSSKTVAATAMTFTWHGCAQGIPGEMRTGNMIHFEKQSTWSWKVWIDNQSRWKVMDWHLMASCWKCMLKAKRRLTNFTWCNMMSSTFWSICRWWQSQQNALEILWGERMQAEYKWESIHCKSKCVW